MNERKNGVIKFIKRERGYGFIRDSDTLTDYFFAANEMSETFDMLEIGDGVTFLVADDNRNPNRCKAVEIQIEKKEKLM